MIHIRDRGAQHTPTCVHIHARYGVRREYTVKGIYESHDLRGNYRNLHTFASCANVTMCVSLPTVYDSSVSRISLNCVSFVLQTYYNECEKVLH